MIRLAQLSVTCIAAFLLVGCTSKQTPESAVAAASQQPVTAAALTSQQPAIVEGHPDKRPMITRATVMKVRNVNDLDAHLRFALVRWSKPSTGETVYNLLVCEAARNDCQGLNVGQEYGLTWLQRDANFAIYQNQGYQTVLLADLRGAYNPFRRQGKEVTDYEAQHSLLTGYAVLNLSKAGKMQAWATNE